MTDLAALGTGVLAELPVDGNSIGNQTLYERLEARFFSVTHEQLRAARDALIERGVLEQEAPTLRNTLLRLIPGKLRLREAEDLASEAA